MSVIPRLFICASGGGGNFQALINARDEAGFAIIGMAVDRNCGAIQRAALAGIPVHRLQAIGSAAVSEALDAVVPADIDLVVLAGFMPILSRPFCQKWAGRVINTHPSLLPRHGGKGMYGVKVQEAVLRAGDTEAGCTIHYVNEVIDGGSIILQQAIPVIPGESAWDLGARVFQQENQLIVRAVRDILKQRGY